jgi:D-alanyl-D-alanine carboxypeptidase/D-alanyl-D-alanine-endopeptidase (penicillin-binding protein 4)
MHRLKITFIVYLLFLTVLVSGVPLSTIAQRERRADAQQQTPAAQPSPSPSPSPLPEVSPEPAVAAPKVTASATLPELQAKISEVLARPELSSAIAGLKVVSLDNGRIIFEENANKLLRPASNMKLYTVATALDRLSPDYRFVTSVYASTRPDAAGVVRGDLTVYGRGDPSISARFNNGNYFAAINDLAARIVAAGVKRVEGDLVGDETYFVGPKYGAGWEWEDLTWYYGAEVTPLTVNDNALDLFIKPGLAVGQPAVITTGPPDPLLKIVNKVTTSAKGLRRELSIHRGLGEDTITITGSIALEDNGYRGGIGISHPALLFVYMLRSALAEKGVVITGKSRTTGEIRQPSLSTAAPISGTNGSAASPGPFQNEIVTLQSPPFSLIAAQTLKPSQNLYTELILRTLGKVTPPPATMSSLSQTSESLGLEAVRSFLKTAGIRPEALVLDDGSGLSRSDMITADATVQLLTFMSKHRYANVFRDALPTAGVDGTLRNRMRGTAAENNVRAKTGSLSSAASLAGYVTTTAGEKLAFAIIVNNYTRDVEPRSLCIDPITVLLASFAGKPELKD